ncbi:Alpha/Beta hydrolase protein [Mycena rosella]|uniref:Alpha/Beta hydrolase protein n=1 Tax=Mycena rosella TaxID=1033263 RepID=A0AAD7DJF1_MYCRO|nr:Alpha/Beta hydrolase protein [Mycena rosella]
MYTAAGPAFKPRYGGTRALLNAELPQFTHDIAVQGLGTLNIYYVHKRSAVEGAIPLLFVHGWPGSFIEARKITPLLTEAHPVVVALSLPGFGFSEAPRKKSFRLAQYAEVGHNLMLALGYSEYVTQGGDWGCMITRKIATVYGGKHTKAWHPNLPVFNPLHILSALAMILLLLWMSAATKAGLLRSQERLVAWTDEYPWDDDEVLTWMSIYWFSRAGPAASLRIYYEVEQEDGLLPPLGGPHPTIPLGYSYFPREVFDLPRSWARRTGNVVFEAEHEVPAFLVGDLRKMFGRGGPAYGVVPGRSGY